MSNRFDFRSIKLRDNEIELLRIKKYLSINEVREMRGETRVTYGDLIGWFIDCALGNEIKMAFNVTERA